ncbi:alpha/beta hydrolase [Desulfosporosinus sp. PR]|uniref:alpha/beta hydrolase n=1 Tax=Candidatus Desulfosporosinus nitrosoreducens TaxID=3401928 RepID=UPI0027ED68E2|nr:alpha/beta hydrolase [Desulfosporosinus sp. PR]MDQ7093714.1 alpha/beta hydrolase [Desulfosporosinus sp. PR]
MLSQTFTFKSGEGTEIFGYKWLPEQTTKVKGLVQIAHGMAETGARYERVAEKLTANGYIVYIHDHRGHGKTAQTLDKLGILAETKGFKWLVEDLHQLSGMISKDYPELPLFLLGHSMGSFVTQKYIMLYGKALKGAILSGSCGKQGILLSAALYLAKAEVKKHGRKARSEKLTKVTLGNYNKAFKPKRTDFDWLSRDAAEVDKYIQDPFCGTVFSAGFFEDFLGGLKDIEDKRNLALVPIELPIYIFSGEKDPVGKNGRGVIKLVKTYQKMGLRDVSYKLYQDGRHEMFNEVNRDEVIGDVIAWLDRHIDG